MKWTSHIAIGASIGAMFSAPLVPVAILGSTAPDWLEWVYTAVTRRKIKHRGPTHYVSRWVVALLCGLFVWDFHHIVTGFALGGLSHLFCDSLTPSGVPLSGFSSNRFTLFGGKIKTGEVSEHVFTGVFVVACLAVALATHSWGGEYSPFFYDWADGYKRGLVDPVEWKEHRFRWL